MPSQDTQTTPTRADVLDAVQQGTPAVLAAIEALAASVATLQATALNNQTAIGDIAQRLTDAGLEGEPYIFAAILDSARTD